MKETSQIYSSLKKIYKDSIGKTKMIPKDKDLLIEDLNKHFAHYGLEIVFTDDGYGVMSENYDKSFAKLFEDITDRPAARRSIKEIYDFFKDKYDIELISDDDSFFQYVDEDQGEVEYSAEGLSQVFDEFGISTIEELIDYIKDLEKDSSDLWNLIRKYNLNSVEDLDKILKNSTEKQRQ